MIPSSVKPVSSLKRLVSLLDGTLDHGLFLQNVEEDKCILDMCRNDEMICDKINVPQEKSEAKFHVEALVIPCG